MRAILIDSNLPGVFEIDIKGGDFREIAKYINCNIITGGYSFLNQDYLYCDDEGLLDEITNGFEIHEQNNYYGNVQLVGNALIVGSDEDGNDIDAQSNIEYIKSIISFKTFQYK